MLLSVAIKYRLVFHAVNVGLRQFVSGLLVDSDPEWSGSALQATVICPPAADGGGKGA